MYLINTYFLVTLAAVLGIVLSVDVDSVCLIPSASPMIGSTGTYKIIYMDRVDLKKIKSGKILFLRKRPFAHSKLSWLLVIYCKPVVVGNPQNINIYHLATYLLLSQYYYTGFGDPNVGACDLKVGPDLAIKKR
jgi:hypothetical protein